MYISKVIHAGDYRLSLKESLSDPHGYFQAKVMSLVPSGIGPPVCAESKHDRRGLNNVIFCGLVIFVSF